MWQGSNLIKLIWLNSNTFPDSVPGSWSETKRLTRIMKLDRGYTHWFPRRKFTFSFDCVFWLLNEDTCGCHLALNFFKLLPHFLSNKNCETGSFNWNRLAPNFFKSFKEKCIWIKKDKLLYISKIFIKLVLTIIVYLYYKFITADASLTKIDTDHAHFPETRPLIKLLMTPTSLAPALCRAHFLWNNAFCL